MSESRGVVKVRLEGLPDDVSAMALWMRTCFVVVTESEDYPNRAPSQYVRRYLEIKAEDPPKQGRKHETDNRV